MTQPISETTTFQDLSLAYAPSPVSNLDGLTFTVTTPHH